MSGTDYYIVVKKDASGKFTIENEIPKDATGSDIILDKNTPTAIINDKNINNIYFPIKVVSGNSIGATANKFTVDSIEYSLVLNTPFTEYETNGKLINDAEFIKMHNAFNLNNSNNSNSNSTSTSTATSTTTSVPSPYAPPATSVPSSYAPPAYVPPVTASTSYAPPAYVPPVTASTSATSVSPPPPPSTISSILKNIISNSTTYDDFINKVKTNKDIVNIDTHFNFDNFELVTDKNKTLFKEYVVFKSDEGETTTLNNNREFIKIGTNNTNLYLYVFKASAYKGGKKQKQRRSKRNYSKKQRKQWAKNNTLRNYIKETHGIHSP